MSCDCNNYPSEKDLEKNRLLGIFEGASARTIFNLTSGAFLVGLLKFMGASDTVCGYILAMPVLAGVIQILSPIILESLTYRKKTIMIGSMVHRLLLTSLIIIPFLPMASRGKLITAGIVFFISNMAVSFVNPAVSNMYVSFVPQNIRGKYFGMRESYLLLAATLVTLAMGKVLDDFTDSGSEATGHVIVYAVIFIFTIINFLSYLFMKEVPLTHSAERLKLSEIFTLPLKDKKFLTYFIMLIIWNIAVQIAGSYFSVYIKSDLKMSYTAITILSLVNSVFYVLTARLWGKFADKRCWADTTMTTVGILAVCHILWFLSSEESPYVLVFLILAHITGGVAWSGINVALFNLQFDFTPDEKRTVYIGFSAASSGIIGYLAAVIGSQLVGLFGNNNIVIMGIGFDIKQLLFLASALLLLILSLYIKCFMRPVKATKR